MTNIAKKKINKILDLEKEETKKGHEMSVNIKKVTRFFLLQPVAKVLRHSHEKNN